MNFILFIISALMMGFLSAIPVGPIQIEVARRALSGNRRSAFMVIVGAAFSDTLYGAIAFFGIAHFLKEKTTMAWFWLAGGIILIPLGILVLRHGLRDSKLNPQSFHLGKKRWALLTGISLSITNPMMILWWLLGSRLFLDLGLISSLDAKTASFFICSGVFGLASYLIILTFFLYWVKRFISDTTAKRINVISGFLLLLISVYFIASSLRVLL